MSKKVRRVPVILDAGEIKDLPQEDIQMILRGADELILTGGRSNAFSKTSIYGQITYGIRWY